MKMSSRIVALVLSLAGASSLILAQAPPPLNIKLGLWEMTMTMDMGAAPPGVDTSKMTPEQIAQMRSMMRGRGASMPPVVNKSCMTRAKLAEYRLTTDRDGTTCTSTLVKGTATSMDLKQVCTGTNPSTSDIHVDAPSQTDMKMTMKPTSGRGAGMTITMASKWLQADCGEIK